MCSKRLQPDTTHSDHAVSIPEGGLGACTKRSNRRLCIGPASSLSYFFRHHGFTDWGQGDTGQLQVLDTERDANDADEAQDSRAYMPQRQPDAGEQEPDDVAQHAKAAVTEVSGLVELLAADSLLAEREEGELTDNKARPSPWDTHDGEECDETDEPPGQTHNDPAQDEPKKIANCAHLHVPYAGIVPTTL